MTPAPLPDARGRYPFAVGTTSYIFDEPQDNIVFNIQQMQGAVDFVQLCLFGKEYIDDFLSPRVLDALECAAGEKGLDCVVHLPMDYTLIEADEAALNRCLNHIEAIMARLGEIPVAAYILHIDNYRFEAALPLAITSETVERFGRVIDSIESRFQTLASRIHIENTAYDLTAMAAALNGSRLGVCMDVGHLIVEGLSMAHFIETYGPRIGSVHIHGVDDGRDHRALTFLTENQKRSVIDFLRTFRGLTVIEVFSANDLVPSMRWLEEQF